MTSYTVPILVSKNRLVASWEKYGLIVVGNIVFFSLLYFISYRPHNTESRAAEFLSLAQQEDADDNFNAAIVLYEKIVDDYPDTTSARVATTQLEKIRNGERRSSEEADATIPQLDMDQLLQTSPALYMAQLLADSYAHYPEHQSRMRTVMRQYLSIAINRDGVSLDTVKEHPAFDSTQFQKLFFRPTVACRMTPGWIFDDFVLVNTSLFPITDVQAKITIAQGDRDNRTSLKILKLTPGQRVDIDSFRVKKNDGRATCSGTFQTAQGSARFKNTF